MDNRKSVRVMFAVWYSAGMVTGGDWTWEMDDETFVRGTPTLTRHTYLVNGGLSIEGTLNGRLYGQRWVTGEAISCLWGGLDGCNT